MTPWTPSPDTLAILADHEYAAVDYETYFKKKQCSVQQLGPQAYCRHQDFYAYLVSIYSVNQDGTIISYVGPPELAPWAKIRNKVWVAHNAAFDREVHRWCVGTWPRNVLTNVRGWVDTAMLSTYLRAGRTLKQAAEQLLGVEMAKTLRDAMSGKHYRDLAPDDRQALCEYALKDAETTFKLWVKYHRQWPEMERWLGQHTLHLHDRGVRVDREKLEEGIREITTRRWHAVKEIPWALDDEDDGDSDEDDDFEGIASNPKFVAHCRAHNVEPPTTTSAKKEEFVVWRKQVGDFGKFADALILYRKCNRLLRLLETIKSRTHAGNGRMPVALKYAGAHTMRWSGDSGFNIQNLTKSDELGVDLRSIFVPSPGMKFCIVDLSQIEPRVLAWLAGDWDFLKLVATGMSPYEAHARVAMGWTGGKLKDEDPVLYALAKARVLALGYGAGWQKFITMATGYLVNPKTGKLDEVAFDAIFRAPVTQEQHDEFVGFLEWSKAKRGDTLLDEFDALPAQDQLVWVNAFAQVNAFRDSNPLLSGKGKDGGPVGIWKSLMDALVGSRKDTLRVQGPNGYALEYYSIEFWGQQGWSAQVERGGHRKRMWAGILIENLCQMVARFVFAPGVRRLEEAGFPVIFTVHDEAVVEVPIDADKSVIRTVEGLLAQTPSWMPGLPVASEGKFANHYKK
jgi:hypothetical protein